MVTFTAPTIGGGGFSSVWADVVIGPYDLWDCMSNAIGP